MNVGAGYPCPSAPSKPQPPPAHPKVLHGAQGAQGCHSSSNDIFLPIHTSGFKPSQHLQPESSCQRAIREAGALINASLSWQMTVLGHELSPDNENPLK